MTRIIGDGVIPEVRAFYDVRDWLQIDCVLAAHLCKITGDHLDGEVVYNMEPLYDGCRSFSIGYLETLKRCTVLDYCARNVAYLATLGIEAFHLPYGYHESLTRHVQVEKDIDFLMVGSINERRVNVLAGLQQYGVFVWVQGAYGADLDRLIARAKVVVNCHYCDSHPLEVVRLNYLMANDCNIVSELGNDPTVNAKYESGILFTDDVVAACRYALDNPKNSKETVMNIQTNQTEALAWVNVRSKLCLG